MPAAVPPAGTPNTLTDLDISENADRFVRWYRQLWRQRGGPPARQGADTLDIPELLPWIWMYERSKDGDYLCRFAGQRIDRRWQFESVQFLRLSEILPEDRFPKVVKRIELCIAHAGIAHGWTSDTDPASGRRVERCFAPLTGQDGRTDTIIGVSLYGAEPIQRAAHTTPPFVNVLKLYDPETLTCLCDLD